MKRKGFLLALLIAVTVLMFSGCDLFGKTEAAPAAALTVSDEEESSKQEVSSKPEESSKQETASKSEESSKQEISSKPEESSKQEISSKPEESSKQQTTSKTETSSKQQTASKPEESSKQQTSSKQEESAKAEVNSKPGVSIKHESSVQQSSEESKYIEIEGIMLSANNIRLYVGDNYTLYASMVPDTATRTDFRWNWSDDSVVSMDSNGVVTAKKIGKATITATTHNGKNAVCEVEVVKKPPEPVVSNTPSKPASSIASTPASGKVSDNWFDDAVFVGDSVSNMLALYSEDGSLGNADFLTRACLGYNNSLWDLNYQYAVHPSYYGKTVTVDEGVRLSGKKKVFIMLGMNDIGGYGVEGTINGMNQLADRILAKSPGVQIYIQSVTPLIPGMVRDDMLNNANVAKFNKRAAEVCKERGFKFINVAEAVSDSNGALIYDYCSDPDYMGLHMNFKGVEKWVAYLKTHTG